MWGNARCIVFKVVEMLIRYWSIHSMLCFLGNEGIIFHRYHPTGNFKSRNSSSRSRSRNASFDFHANWSTPNHFTCNKVELQLLLRLSNLKLLSHIPMKKASKLSIYDNMKVTTNMLPNCIFCTTPLLVCLWFDHYINQSLLLFVSSIHRHQCCPYIYVWPLQLYRLYFKNVLFH